jgi:hypothetical protein
MKKDRVTCWYSKGWAQLNPPDATCEDKDLNKLGYTRHGRNDTPLMATHIAAIATSLTALATSFQPPAWFQVYPNSDMGRAWLQLKGVTPTCVTT